jgi:hypothetical protein
MEEKLYSKRLASLSFDVKEEDDDEFYKYFDIGEEKYVLAMKIPEKIVSIFGYEPENLYYDQLHKKFLQPFDHKLEPIAFDGDFSNLNNCFEIYRIQTRNFGEAEVRIGSVSGLYDLKLESVNLVEKDAKNDKCYAYKIEYKDPRAYKYLKQIHSSFHFY